MWKYSRYVMFNTMTKTEEHWLDFELIKDTVNLPSEDFTFGRQKSPWCVGIVALLLWSQRHIDLEKDPQQVGHEHNHILAGPLCPFPWHHNERDGVSNHQPHDCLLNRLFGANTKNQSSASLAFVRGIRRWPVNSSNKGPVTRKMYPSCGAI